MLQETKSLLHKLKTEGIGSSIAGMHRGLSLLEQLVECEPEVAIKYFKGVAAACEHISGKFLGETYKPVKGITTPSLQKQSVKTESTTSKIIPNDPLAGAAFILQDMPEAEVRTEVDESVVPELNQMQSLVNDLI